MTGHQRERQTELKNRFAALLGGGAPTAAPEPEAPPAPPPAPAETEVPARAARRRATPAAPRREPAAPVAPMPITQEGTDATRPKRLMVPLSVDEDRALKEYRLDDGLPAAARMRAMLQLYREDERFRKRVDAVAQRMR